MDVEDRQAVAKAYPQLVNHAQILRGSRWRERAISVLWGILEGLSGEHYVYKGDVDSAAEIPHTTGRSGQGLIIAAKACPTL